MRDTFLFDLDGTLLPLDLQQFTKVYFQEIGNAFQDIIDPKTLRSHILMATAAMVANLDVQTNETVFMKNFGSLIDGDLDTFRKRFDDFYDQGFFKTRAVVAENPIIKETVALLKNKGYQLMIATNPIFPKKAILHRLRWAGLQPDDFIYISCYEENHYCKPQIDFYRELMSITCKRPEQCYMVGNDVREDLIAGNLGIKTYLITDYLIHTTGDEIRCDYRGTYEEFYRFVVDLPCVYASDESKDGTLLREIIE